MPPDFLSQESFSSWLRLNSWTNSSWESSKQRLHTGKMTNICRVFNTSASHHEISRKKLSHSNRVLVSEFLRSLSKPIENPRVPVKQRRIKTKNHKTLTSLVYNLPHPAALIGWCNSTRDAWKTTSSVIEQRKLETRGGSLDNRRERSKLLLKEFFAFSEARVENGTKRILNIEDSREVILGLLRQYYKQ